MAFFVDANVVIYAATEGPYHDACAALLVAVSDGADARTSTAVLEEVWHTELSGRVGRVDGLARRAYTLFTPVLPVTDEVLAAALTLEYQALGTNDRVHAATCLVNGIDTIVSADRGFDTVRGLRRIDPLDQRAVRRLLA